MGIKRKLLLGFAACLVLLQVALPFLHAHTGITSKSGFHLHFYTVASADHSSEVTVQATQDADSGEVAIANLKDRESERLPFPLSQRLYVVAALITLLAVYLSPLFWKQGWLFSLPIKKYSSPNFYLPALAPPQANL